ncbi:MAG TPA: MFS transporter [Actinomycetota bacterium]|nr:MFS transporter [Actinomycetota bacterium]
MSQRARARSVLRDPAVARAVAARFVSRTGGAAAFFVGVWGKSTYDLDATPGQLALVMAAMAVFSLAGSAASGVLVDRHGPRRVVIAGEVVFVPATLSLALAGSMPEMTLLMVPAAFFAGVVFTAVAAFPPFLTDDDDALHRINAAMEAAMSLSFVAGPALGAVLVRYWGIDWVFVLDAVTSLVAAAIVRSIAVRRVARRDRGTGWRELREGFRCAYSTRALRLPVVLGSAVWLCFGTFGALEPIFYREVLGTGPEALGWINSVFGLGLIAGSFLLDRMPPERVNARVMVLAGSLCGVAAILYAGTDDLRVVVLGVVLWGVDLGVLFPLVRTLVHVNTPEGYAGRVTGAAEVHKQGGELVPLAFVGALAGSFGVQRVLIGSGVLLIAVMALAAREAAAVDRAARPVGVVHPLPAEEPRNPAPTTPA